MIKQQSHTYDFHSHTTASDGELSPDDLVKTAKEAGLTILAITDHDTTNGIADAITTSIALGGITIIPGVEISCQWGSEEIHIVGLNIDPTAKALQQRLAQQQENRRNRAILIGEKLVKHGYPNIYQAACDSANSLTPGRPHFARALVAQGYCSTIQKAFSTLLGQGKKAYVKTEWSTIQQAIDAIQSTGGFAVIAHPGKYKCTRTKLSRLIAEFSTAGGTAIEVATSSHTIDQQRMAATFAKQYNLYASAGSDFHGFNTSWGRLGQFPALPLSCRPIQDIIPVFA